MLKKLQNLLFEDDDDDDIDDDEEEVAAPAPRPVKKPAERREPQTARPVQAAPVQEKPSIQRIDVTGAVPKVDEKPVEKPAHGSVFSNQEAPVREEKPAEKKTLGITIEDAPKPRPAKKRAVPQQKTVKKEESETAKKQSYEFRPVISPIFGVDEKDMNALKNTTSRINNVEKEKKDPNISPIISPMYGVDEEDQPSTVGDTVERSEANEKVVGNLHNYQAEDDIPEFSLDDILKVRDEEFEEQQEKAKKAEQKPVEKEADESAPSFPDLSLDEDEDEPADQTVVIRRDDIKDAK